MKHSNIDCTKHVYVLRTVLADDYMSTMSTPHSYDCFKVVFHELSVNLEHIKSKYMPVPIVVCNHSEVLAYLEYSGQVQ